MPFRDIIGHGKLVALLSRSIAGDSLPPSLILSGPSGVGKRLAALASAQALNCLSPDTSTSQSGDRLAHDACGVCSACTRIARGVHPDVLVLEPNEKGNIRIEAARDLVERAAYRPFEGRRRVAIVDQAEALEPGAQNALLKLLEEPPAGSVFLLVTAYPDLLLPTVRSRCPQLRFRPLSPDDVARALLASGRGEDEARAVAALADGSIGRALAATAGDLVDARGAAMNVLADLATHDDVRRRMEQAKVLTGAGAGDRAQLAVQLRAMASLLRDVEVLESGADRRALANPDLASRLDRVRASFAGDRGRLAFLAIDRALAALDRYANSKLVADWLVLQL
ncbi:MAG: DNA polymerase III subunit delta' [Vicinamibacterales bacterium]